MLELFAFWFIGIFVGFLAGILPGIHPNQVYVLLLSFLPLLNLSPQSLIAFIISVGISNIIFNYITSIFFSIPDPNTVLNILPGHRMVLEGNGLKALFISISSAMLTFIVIVGLTPLFLILLPMANELFQNIIHFLLIGLALWMLLLEKGIKKRLLTLSLFLLSGLWGIVTMNSAIIDSSWILFPTLTGMFGLASLLTSTKGIDKIPSQDKSEVNVKGHVKILITGITAGFLTGILPGAGETQAGTAVSQLSNLTQEQFLGSLASINVSNILFSLLALFSFEKIRSGLTVGINSIVNDFDFNWLLFSMGVILLTSGVSTIICWFIGKRMIKLLEKINYVLISKLIFVFTVIMILLLTGFVGLFVAFVSTCLGLLALLWDVKRTSNMGFLMLPLILYFSGLSNVTSCLLF